MIDIYTQERDQEVASLTKEQKKTFDRFIKARSKAGLFKSENPYDVRQETEIARAIKANIDIESGAYEANVHFTNMRLTREYWQSVYEKYYRLDPQTQSVVAQATKEQKFDIYQTEQIIDAATKNVPLDMFTKAWTPEQIKDTANHYFWHAATIRRFNAQQVERYNNFLAMQGNVYNICQLCSIAEAVIMNVSDLSKYAPDVHHENMTLFTAQDYSARFNLEEDRAFLDNTPATSIPIQGWKIHVSCENAHDFMRGLSIMLPELVKNNVTFKIVNPQRFQFQPGSNLYGKEFTIYPNENFKLSNFSQTFINYLNEKAARQPATDHNLGNRVNIRYGIFRGGLAMHNTLGQVVEDRREAGYYKPDFVDDTSLEQILKFPEEIKSQLDETGDYKLYLQQILTGIKYTSMDKYFVDSYEVSEADANIIRSNVAKTSKIEVNGKTFISIADEDAKARFKEFCMQSGIKAIVVEGNSLYKGNDTLNIDNISNYTDKTINLDKTQDFSRPAGPGEDGAI